MFQVLRLLLSPTFCGINLDVTVKMVCTKCQKLEKQTELATPGVNKKNEIYYGSPALSAATKQSKPSATLGNTGIGKVTVKCLSAQSAPY